MSRPGDDSFAGVTDVDPARLRTKQGNVSRVDTLPEDFAKMIGQRALGVGHVIGSRYKLLERLGGGAMGDVFVAENLAIGTRVAVKLLKAELLADADFRQRFQHEAQAIASIEHPNVARFLDLVVSDPTFLVMEYVRGATLSAALRERGKLEPARAVHIARRLCWALHAAHHAGIIHRDLKPANVVLSSDVEHEEVPKVIDFGLAKLATVNRALTRAGQLIGTPQYMSPEQIAGKSVDARTDIYALGCVLHEMLTGRPPFPGTDDFQVIYKQVHETAPPLRTLVPDAPAELEGVLACMLAKHPEERYATMADCAAALAAAFQPSGGERAAAPAAERVEPAPARRRLGTLALAAAAAVALALGGGFLAARLAGGRSGHRPSLFVLSDPSGAHVEVDGKRLAQTTPTLTTSLPPGAHTVKVQREGTTPISQAVTLKAGERSVVQVTLPPASHRVEIRSVPDGAQVLLDQRMALGETPTSVEVTDDDFHELRVEKTGYETVVKAITPDHKERTMSFTLTPEKQPRGTLVVDANSAAELWIDGVNTGYTTPTLGVEVAAGKHLVELRDGAGRRGPSTTVVIVPGQTVRLLLGAQAEVKP